MDGNALCNSSMRQKRNSGDLVDRISALPDSILGIILSSLPTKNGVATAVLSKRWKLVWTTVHNLDLCYDDSRGKPDERDDMRFVGFVNRVLLLHDVGWLNKFRLVWTPRCISSHAASWISTAISKNVHELFLLLETHTLRTSPEPFIMPVCVFSCDTLRFLELNGGISISTAIAVCLPKLETLKLSSVYFQSEESFEKLIRGCPVLINLFIISPNGMLIEFHQDDDFTYIISSTSLRHLELSIEYPAYEVVYINLELEASSLEYLTLYGFIPVFLVQKSLSSLVEAHLHFDLGEHYFSDADKCNSVVEVVRMFECAKVLLLSADVIWALCFATISLSTEFKRLVKLDADTYCCACSSLRDFIQCSDNLQVLTMHQYEYPTIVEEDDHDHDHTSWTPPVQVPRCLSNNLKKVELYDYYGREDEREMIRYMLKHGSALEVVEISCAKQWKDSKLELVQEICEFSKKLSSKFPACEVKFAGETSKCNVKVL